MEKPSAAPQTQEAAQRSLPPQWNIIWNTSAALMKIAGVVGMRPPHEIKERFIIYVEDPAEKTPETIAQFRLAIEQVRTLLASIGIFKGAYLFRGRKPLEPISYALPRSTQKNEITHAVGQQEATIVLHDPSTSVAGDDVDEAA